jgi:hypothetical protein
MLTVERVAGGTWTLFLCNYPFSPCRHENATNQTGLLLYQKRRIPLQSALRQVETLDLDAQL